MNEFLLKSIFFFIPKESCQKLGLMAAIILAPMLVILNAWMFEVDHIYWADDEEDVLSTGYVHFLYLVAFVECIAGMFTTGYVFYRILCYLASMC